VLGLLLAAAAFGWQQPGTVTKRNAKSGKAMAITYEAKIRQMRWVVGAQVVLDLEVRNGSTAAFEMPDLMYRTSSEPIFELQGPGGKKQAFRPNSRATEKERSQKPPLVRIAPGEHWEGDLTVSRYVDLSEPGHYTLLSSIAGPGGRIEAPPVEFDMVRASTRDMTAESSAGEDGSRIVECVELLDGGQVVSSLMTETDPGNAELLPLNRRDRGEADPDSTAVFAPYSNYSVGMSAVRFIVTESHHKVLVSHNLRPARITAFGGSAVSHPLQPVATHAGLYLAAVKDSELALTRFTATDTTLDAGPVWTVEKLKAPPAAAAMTVSPAAAGSTLLFVMAVASGGGTQVRLLTVSPQGKVIARAEHHVGEGSPLGYAAAGWSTSGELRATVLVQKDGEARAVEFRMRPDLSVEGEARVSRGVAFASGDARVAYFEAMPGQMSRMVLVRTAGRVVVIGADGSAVAAKSAVPGSGPVAVLPGRSHWYAVWPDKGKLAVGVL
jgi:hypothetical protein